jgi:hypothetical protein
MLTSKECRVIEKDVKANCDAGKGKYPEEMQLRMYTFTLNIVSTYYRVMFQPLLSHS